MARVSAFIHLLQFKRPVGAEDDAENTRGDVALSYVDHFKAWGSVEPLTTREQLVAAQVRPDVTHKVTMYASSKLTHRHKFTWSGRTFDVGPPFGLDGERGLYTQFYATEVRG